MRKWDSQGIQAVKYGKMVNIGVTLVQQAVYIVLVFKWSSGALPDDLVLVFYLIGSLNAPLL